MIKAFALWKQKTKKGETYLSGTMGDLKVIVFANNKKERENQPDYVGYFDERQRKPDGGQPGAGEPDYTDNDVPF